MPGTHEGSALARPCFLDPGSGPHTPLRTEASRPQDPGSPIHPALWLLLTGGAPRSSTHMRTRTRGVLTVVLLVQVTDWLCPFPGSWTEDPPASHQGWTGAQSTL